MTLAPTLDPEPSSAPSASPVQADRQPPVRSVALPPLPRQGVVLSDEHGVRFVGLDGDEIALLRHFELAYGWIVPGPVLFKQHRTWFLLRVGAHQLRPLPSREAAARIGLQFQAGVDPMSDTYLGLPLPHSRTDRSGFWAYALPSPDGSMLLEQWSGECEAPVAFLAGPGGADPRPVTGSWGLRHAGESRGLGWTTDGRAVVDVFDSPCGDAFDRPGVYLVDGPGDGTLLLATRDGARMWGTA
jgi:hypothetical protein